MQILLEISLGRAMVGQNEFKHAHSINMHRFFEERHVKGALSWFISLSQWTVIILVFIIRPLLFYACEDFARNARDKDTFEELAAEFIIFHDVERLLENVEAGV